MAPIEPKDAEIRRRDTVIAALLGAIERGETIKLPPFDASVSIPGSVAAATVGVEPNTFGGSIGEFRYQFEGEEDLLHLIVTRLDQGELSPEQGQAVAHFLFPEVPPGLIWIKPGRVTQHFFVGHEVLSSYQRRS